MNHRALAGALLLAAAPAAHAQSAEIMGRLTNVFGNFLVGAGPVADSGGFSELLTVVAPSYSQQAADAGAVNGVFNGQPVVGSASFASQAAYAFDGLQLVADGAAATTGDTPFSYVSLGANSISTVRLDIRVPVQTHYVLTGSVFSTLGPSIGSNPSEARASVQFTAPGAGQWHTDTFQGGFAASGTLLAGSTYRITGNATTRINGSGQYAFNLVLTPVPEPAAWMLLALGVPMLLARRLRNAR